MCFGFSDQFLKFNFSEFHAKTRKLKWRSDVNNSSTHLMFFCSELILHNSNESFHSPHNFFGEQTKHNKPIHGRIHDSWLNAEQNQFSDYQCRQLLDITQKDERERLMDCHCSTDTHNTVKQGAPHEGTY